LSEVSPETKSREFNEISPNEMIPLLIKTLLSNIAVFPINIFPVTFISPKTLMLNIFVKGIAEIFVTPVKKSAGGTFVAKEDSNVTYVDMTLGLDIQFPYNTTMEKKRAILLSNIFIITR
jgi:hypothetical protein